MLCLERSISLCTALITIGIPSQVVIGKSSYHITNLFEFHSWVEIDEIVITDSNIIKKQFIEISRFPVLKVWKEVSIMNNNYEKPSYIILGDMFELTGSTGKDNDDGYGYDKCA